MSTKRKTIIKRTFRGEYELDYDSLDKSINIPQKKIYINHYDSCENNIKVNGQFVVGSSSIIEHVAKCGNGSQQLMNIVVSDTLEAILMTVPFKSLTDLLTFKKTKDYSHMRTDVRLMIKEFISFRKEILIRDMFFERIQFTNKSDRITQLKSVGNTFGYFVVPKDGTSYTNSIKNMVMVKSDPRNGYLNIIDRTWKCISEKHKDFEFLIKDPNAQLNKELTEDIIPFV